MNAPLDEYVAAVESFLADAVTHRRLGVALLSADAALWLCPCYSDTGAPTLLLLHDAVHGLGWSWLPDKVGVESVVATERVAGWHTTTVGVLQWLRGEVRDPLLDGGDDDQRLVDFFANALGDTRGAR